jgi:predicted nucleic acid-binding protein
MRSRTGASHQLLLAVADGLLVPVVKALLLEYEAVLTRPTNLAAIGKTLASVANALDDIAGAARLVETYISWRPAVRDANDDLLIDAAMNGGAEAIVTFNRRDLRPADPGGPPPSIAILSPAEMLRRSHGQ